MKSQLGLDEEAEERRPDRPRQWTDVGVVDLLEFFLKAMAAALLIAVPVALILWAIKWATGL